MLQTFETLSQQTELIFPVLHKDEQVFRDARADWPQWLCVHTALCRLCILTSRRPHVEAWVKTVPRAVCAHCTVQTMHSHVQTSPCGGLEADCCVGDSGMFHVLRVMQGLEEVMAGG